MPGEVHGPVPGSSTPGARGRGWAVSERFIGSELCSGPVQLQSQAAVISRNSVSSTVWFVILKAMVLEFKS